jgi:GTPase
VEHTEEGTILHARVLPSLFAELEKTSKPVETVEAV